MRLRPGQHLRRNTDFRAVREQGRRVDCGAFLLTWRVRPPSADQPAVPRVGVVASRAAVGNAVHRNRAKRLMRESYRLLRTRLEEFCAQENKTLLLAILYTGEQAVPLPVMQEKMEKALSELMNKINTNGRSSSTLAH